MRGNKALKILDYWLGIPAVFTLGILLKCLGGLTNRGKKHPGILVVKLSAMGDTILLIPVIRSIREAFPGSEITFICTEINSEVLAGNKYINNIIVVNLKKWVYDFYGLFKTIMQIRKLRCDIMIDFDQWLRISAILGAFSFAGKRVGFKTGGQLKHLAFTGFVQHEKNKHELDCFFDLAELIGAGSGKRKLEFDIPRGEYRKIDELLLLNGMGKDDFIIALCPGVPEHGWQRQWPPESFIGLCDRLLEKDKKLKIIVIERNIEDAEKITGRTKNKTIPVCGLSLKSLAGLFSRCNVVICNNTGTMHLAAAAGTNVVGIHGPTNPVKWGPYGEKAYVVKPALSCSPCLYLGYEYGCRTNKCMQSITVEDVFLAVNNLIYR